MFEELIYHRPSTIPVTFSKFCPVIQLRFLI